MAFGKKRFLIVSLFNNRATASKFRKSLSCLVEGGLLTCLGNTHRSNSLKQGLKS